MEIIQLYLDQLPNLKKVGRTHEWKTLCPFHIENTPSFFVNEETGFWYCQACNRGGGVKKFFELIGVPQPNGSDHINIESKKDNSITVTDSISSAVIQQFHRNLFHDQEKLKYVFRTRLISLFVIKKYLLGYDTSTDRYTFPIRSRNGKFINVKLHNSELEPKSLYLKSNAEAKLFPISSLLRQNIVICEGEFDCMALHSIGINAITSTSGAGKGKWNPNWNIFFLNKAIRILYDSDFAGVQGADYVNESLTEYAKSVTIIKFPSSFIRDRKKVDVTDFLREKQNIFKLLGILKRR